MTQTQTQTATARTVAVYQRDENLHTLITRVLAVLPFSAVPEADRALFKQGSDDDHVVTTAETIFYAQGGGQPSDTGIMTSRADDDNGNTATTATFSVSSVRNASEGRILHLGRFGGGGRAFTEGETVTQRIDSAKRILNSRVHTAGHIVGLAVRHLAESITGVTELKGQHYPDLAFVDFRGSIDGKHKDAIQAKVDEFVQRALPVKVYWWNEKELREKCVVVPDNVVIPEGELMRAVDIEGAGAYPCGGTHVRDTSYVGKVLVKKISRSKGNSKVSYSIS